MNAEQRQIATDPWTKPTDLSHWPACRQLRNYVHHLIQNKIQSKKQPLFGYLIEFHFELVYSSTYEYIQRHMSTIVYCYSA